MKRMQDKDGWHDLRQLTLAKARCAKLVIHLIKDERSKKAVEIAEQFGLANATREQLNAAAAYDDAAADARKQMLPNCANEIRNCVKEPLI